MYMFRSRFHTIVLAALGVVALSTASLASDAAGSGADHSGVTQAAASGGWLEVLLFYIAAAAACVSALGVCYSRNIVRMAVWLFGALGSVALLYFLLAANFIAAIQLIVYAGGTLILLVFGVMLTSKSPWARFEARKIEVFGATVVSGTLFACLSLLLTRAHWATTDSAVAGTAMSALGHSLLTTYLVPFELAGVLLMIVMVGAAHLARQDK